MGTATAMAIGREGMDEAEMKGEMRSFGRRVDADGMDELADDAARIFERRRHRFAASRLRGRPPVPARRRGPHRLGADASRGAPGVFGLGQRMAGFRAERLPGCWPWMFFHPNYTSIGIRDGVLVPIHHPDHTPSCHPDPKELYAHRLLRSHSARPSDRLEMLRSPLAS